ncbi:hypothetical protein [Egicoccus sp. AB-alg2]|uniref:hypothetical protein n=1 Tax=Egicoccus sp. AB-alg2 TaxID=3242693 RepID=UPI00359E2F57
MSPTDGLLARLHARHLCLDTSLGYPRAALVATLTELAEESELRALVEGRWRAALGLGHGPDEDAAATVAAVSDVTAAVVRPVLAASQVAGRVPLLVADRVALGWGAGPAVRGVGWLPMELAAGDRRAATRRAARDGLVACLAPLVGPWCAGVGLAEEVGWLVVADTLEDVGMELGAVLGDTVTAAAELVLLLDGRPPLTQRARLEAVAVDGHVRYERVRGRCCERHRLDVPCPACPAASAPARPMLAIEPGRGRARQ